MRGEVALDRLIKGPLMPPTPDGPPWLVDVHTLRQQKGRDKAGRLLLEGLRSVSAAASAQVVIETLLVAPEFYNEGCTAVVEQIQRTGVQPRRLQPRQFSKLSYKAEGLLAVVHYKVPRLVEAEVPLERPLIILDALSDPGNLGSVIRAANAFGASVLVVEGVHKLYHPKSLRASMGAVFHTPVFVASREEAVRWIAASGRPLLTLIPEATASLDAVPWREPLACVIGNEKRGVHASWEAVATDSVCIPMVGMVDSLNAATSATLVLWECRQRRAGAR